MPTVPHPPEAPAAPTILARLRAETRPYHDALEAGPFNEALRAGAPTTAGTVQFLERMFGFLEPYETALRQHEAEFGPAWELPKRYRAHLILEDLQRPAADPGLPLCPAMPLLHTLPQLLGAMYVLEGSTLGGQVITKQLEKAGIPQRRYFAGYGERTGPMWKAFGQLLTETATPATADEIVASAARTFQCLAAWINKP
ncbi:biliverdin-producing heme oxygenase [Hymenobacter properus]|uniref:Biliverdin-producing heme oxygenase n=1 Tax=Hymenobacter properus TaxID=2791026 RepID=A0A931FNC2_9BACT|nr:biliverdin-producing heme oxygenase [Hymenobacter properus]MBF9143986.1 biliverdin-producing heme oxygenase [Hymenobacter properus]MBR7722801.1 biliverdin-producing heme oxygenase [Microvirga sp. SRT04]